MWQAVRRLRSTGGSSQFVKATEESCSPRGVRVMLAPQYGSLVTGGSAVGGSASLVGVERYDEQSQDIRGFFAEPDLALFKWLLRWQLDNGICGDILEIGVLEGKSAALLGYGLRADETLVVNDMFEFPWHDGEVEPSKSAFLSTYARFHSRPPEVMVGPSKHLSFSEDRFRFVHVDGGHTYKDVATDLRTTHGSASSDAVVAVDDYCHPDYPGVGAATWAAVDRRALLPFCVTPGKLYAARSTTAHDALLNALTSTSLPQCDAEPEVVMGLTLLRLQPTRQASRAKGVLRRWTPPAMLDAARRVRRSVRGRS
jgi:hypothetical protein